MLIVLSCLLGRISVGNDEVGGLRWPAYRSSARSKRKQFLVIRFEKANGRATPKGIDAALKMHWPRYAKRMPSTQFPAKQIRGATERVKAKRASYRTALSAPGMTPRIRSRGSFGLRKKTLNGGYLRHGMGHRVEARCRALSGRRHDGFANCKMRKSLGFAYPL